MGGGRDLLWLVLFVAMVVASFEDPVELEVRIGDKKETIAFSMSATELDLYDHATRFAELHRLDMGGQCVASGACVIKSLVARMQNLQGQMRRRHAYVSFLTSDAHLPGVLLLSHQLRRSRYPYVVVCLEAVSETAAHTLRRHGVDVRRRSWAAVLRERDPTGALARLIDTAPGGETEGMRHWPTTILAKGLVFSEGANEFDHCLYLDADLLLHESLDEFLEADLNEATAEDGNAAYIELAPDLQIWTPREHGGGGARHHIFTTTSDEGNHVVAHNSGVMRFRPSVPLFDAYIEAWGMLEKAGTHVSSDQDVVNAMLNQGLADFRTLPIDYNCVSYMGAKLLELGIIEKERITHFIGGVKPWSVLQRALGQIGSTKFGVRTEHQRYNLKLWMETWVELAVDLGTLMPDVNLHDHFLRLSLPSQKMHPV